MIALRGVLPAKRCLRADRLAGAVVSALAGEGVAASEVAVRATLRAVERIALWLWAHGRALELPGLGAVGPWRRRGSWELARLTSTAVDGVLSALPLPGEDSVLRGLGFSPSLGAWSSPCGSVVVRRYGDGWSAGTGAYSSVAGAALAEVIDQLPCAGEDLRERLALALALLDVIEQC